MSKTRNLNFDMILSIILENGHAHNAHVYIYWSGVCEWQGCGSISIKLY